MGFKRSTAVWIVALLFFAPFGVQASTTVTVYLTSGTSWTVPVDWNSASNTIEVIGGGGGGSNYPTGGGGGAYSKISNLSLTPGASAGYAVGSGGAGGPTGGSFTAGGTGGDTYFCNSTSNCASIGGSAVRVGAKGGGGGATSAILTSGGAAGSGVGTTTYSGGNSPAPAGNGSGGGGAGGPNGAGANGGQSPTGFSAGGGGGGGGGGSAGSDTPENSIGGDGGDNSGGTGHGTGGVLNASGTAGTSGGGGGGAGRPFTVDTVGGDGGAGIEWDASHGSGGGGGGAGGFTGSANLFGGDGGLYGAGGGAGGYNGTTGYKGGDGAQGIIVIRYTAAEPALSPVTIASNNASTTLAKAGDVVTVTFTSDLTLASPTVSILGHASTTAINTSGNVWAASTTVITADTQGAAAFLISAPNSVQTGTTTAAAITSGADVVIDTTAPVITLSGSNPDSVPADNRAGYSDPGASATDAHDGSVVVTTSGSVNRAVAGTYTLTYISTDALGNSASASRTVTVTSSGGGGIFYGNASAFFNYTRPRPQIIYPDGRIVYLDTETVPASVPALESAPTSVAAPDSLSFDRNYKTGDVDPDIKRLQLFLNAEGFVLAQTGPGSPGQETNMFGARTRGALIRFQAFHDLPATGYFGPLTRGLLNAL